VSDIGSGKKIRGGYLRRPGHEPLHSREILFALRLNETGVAAAFGVVLMFVSALVLGIGTRR
jgi:hypothetical protein